jgi:hypothetical protein
MVLGAAAALTCGAGCGSSRQLSGGMHAYEVGNFHQAAESCESVDEAALDDRRQVRYYVYCGLAYYHLGDQGSAQRMLSTGRQRYAAGNATWLKPIIVDQMNKALGALGGASVGPIPPYAPDPGSPVLGLRAARTGGPGTRE